MANSQDVMSQVLQNVAGQMEKAIDDEIDRLDNLDEGDYAELRRQRIHQMRKEAEDKENWKREGHGKLCELDNEKEFFGIVKGTTRVVALFVRKSNLHADQLRQHLSIIAEHHLETRFVFLDAEKCPFLVERLKIWMIPSMVLVINQKTNHTVCGLDELTGSGNYRTWELERLLSKYNMVTSHTLEDKYSQPLDDDDDDFSD
mmetsp:Transcript_23726/g.32381  ORF Transcript_23726/g.32381 Transcript_23726/m.32381 type:complete len:202 (+) Transcript_23726:89-694(+)